MQECLKKTGKEKKKELWIACMPRKQQKAKMEWTAV